MMLSSLWLSLVLTASGSSGASVAVDASAPVEVFAELDGTWEGQFVGYDPTGKELYRIEVRQVYRTIDSNTQEVEITDTLADGQVITGRGRNTASKRPDGSLELTCVVVKSTGEKVVHEGTLGQGPEGSPQLVWHSSGPDRLESFRETVTKQGDQWTYSIDGVGHYGKSVILMAGRYLKQPQNEIVGDEKPAPREPPAPQEGS